MIWARDDNFGVLLIEMVDFSRENAPLEISTLETKVEGQGEL